MPGTRSATLDREQIYRVRFHRDALLAKLRKIAAERDDLYKLLGEYENTGDHDHGRGPIKPYADCPGGDCLVARARKLIEAMDAV